MLWNIGRATSAFAFVPPPLDYFWTAMTSGKARSHYGDGEIREVPYAAGDTKHHIYAPGEFMTQTLKTSATHR
jgi:hypothetical protein